MFLVAKLIDIAWWMASQDVKWTDIWMASGAVGSAIGTIGAVIVSLYFSGRDGRRAVEREERKQAEQITAWFDPKPSVDYGDFIDIVIANASTQPAYHVVVSLVAVQGPWRKTAVGYSRSDAAEYRTLIGLIPPGNNDRYMRWHGYAKDVQFGIEIAFRDAAGRSWVRGGTGGLKRVRKDPLNLYSVKGDVTWQRT